jgi:hypothetical protein
MDGQSDGKPMSFVSMKDEAGQVKPVLLPEKAGHRRLQLNSV